MSVLPVGISGEAGAYQIERSLRFNSADSAYLSRTPASAGNRKTWTWSGWVKKTKNDIQHPLFYVGVEGGAEHGIRFRDDDNSLDFFRFSGSYTYRLRTSAIYRDVSAWYHIVAVLDTTQATNTNRVKLYVNGEQILSFQTSTYPNQNDEFEANNTVLHRIGNFSSSYLDGYLTEVHFIDGSALDPTSFGEFDTDTGVWKPKAYSGSYGTNGFYLDFGDNSSTTALGYDAAGSNDWTPNNFSVTAGAGNDSLVDSPTRYGTDTGVGGEVRGNYCTLNPLQNNGTLTNGNLDFADTGSNGWNNSKGTIGVSSGKFYWEMTANNIVTTVLCASVGGAKEALGQLPGQNDSYGVTYYPDGRLYYNGTSTGSWGSTYTTGDIIGIALDMDNGKVWFSKNGTWQASGDPANGTNAARSDLKTNDDTWFAMSGTYYSGTTCTFNFGQRPFAYTAPSGFKALCTTNLPEPTIADGGEYFNPVLYTGNGTTDTSITGVGFQPDWVWVKERSSTSNHNVYDVIRGATKTLYTSATNAEDTLAEALQSFDADGFTVGSGGWINENSQTYVAWNWKANGAGVSNTDGTISSTVSANTTAGFSIVTYTGTANSSETVGHGLGVKPSLIIWKCRSNAENWPVWHASESTYMLHLNETASRQSSWYGYYMGSTQPTSSLFTVSNNGGGADTLGDGRTYVAYCFSAIAGYSAFGSFVGSGSADGPFIFTNHRPAFVMIKRTDSAENWVMYDFARDSYNLAGRRLLPNGSNAEAADTEGLDLISNGFKVRGTSSLFNTNGGTYIYMSLASNPFKLSLAR
jgi:hypothetical protein